jgi:GNAT superfamily N-acetyltransferase
MLNNTELLSIYDKEVRQRAEWTRMTREEYPRIVRHTSHEKIRGALISWFDLEESNSDAEITAQVSHFQRLEMDLVWKVYGHDQPKNIGNRLEAHGFVLDGSDALMVIDLDEAPDYFWSPPLENIRHITSPHEVDAVMEMERVVWTRDFSRLGEGLKMDLSDAPKHLSMYGVFEGDRALSAAWMYYLDPAPFAMLLGGTTLPEHRGQGYYTALLAARALEARERGIHYLTVDASEMSRPILENHGFIHLDDSREYELIYKNNK